MIGNICILLLFALFLLDKLVMIVYCRMMENIDRRRLAKRTRKITVSSDEKLKQNPLKKFRGLFTDHVMYGWMRYSILMTGKIPSHKIRNILYRYIYNMKITKKTVIYGGCEIRSPWNFHADNCVISTNCLLDAREGIYIGNNVVFGGNVHIWTQEHDVDSPFFSVTDSHRGKIVIEDWAWICSDSTILPGIFVHEGAVLAARACAVRDLEAYGIYGGVPAKLIKMRNNNLKYELSGKPHWYFY